ncbi:hypothetical protein GWR56_01850 [Mucilaginibacter sp. 14171R-50]|uniref:hypothetical protein n=1 Tax=Mucilaginibacter sp. 14171R-50 TaxID=2703789 RepID=UPI00138B2F93|nr:hypothetical protein [Mucilaginibacter sp. 14171R-50]QHS54345.1 hypothetical protein GWR56_01850 [Mucilaginibacter sp. 14171R-50]
MDMQDKEIDRLFKSGLDNLEAEPSDKVWADITFGLDMKKRRWKTYLSVAASLIILLSAGLYFMYGIKDAEKPVQITAVKVNKPVKAIEPIAAAPETIEPLLQKSVALNATTRPRRQKVKNNTTPDVLLAPVVPVPHQEILQPATQLAQTVQKTEDDIKFVVPDKQTPLNEKIIMPDEVSATPATLAAQPVTGAKTIAAAPAKKHRIRTLGDLINVVVSKVDKRKDKLIEFSDTKDEDESIVSGLNLGFIKIKKQD